MPLETNLYLDRIMLRNMLTDVSVVTQRFVHQLKERRVGFTLFVNSTYGVNYLLQIWHGWLLSSFIC